MPGPLRVLVGAAAAIALVGPAAAGPAQSGIGPPVLIVHASDPVPPLRFALTTLPSKGLPTKLEVDVPAGYTVDLSTPPGSDRRIHVAGARHAAGRECWVRAARGRDLANTTDVGGSVRRETPPRGPDRTPDRRRRARGA